VAGPILLVAAVGVATVVALDVVPRPARTMAVTPTPTTTVVLPPSTARTALAVKCISSPGIRPTFAGTVLMRTTFPTVVSPAQHPPPSLLISIGTSDSGAINHIIGELEKMTMHEWYNGGDWIHVANDANMDIFHIDKSVLPNPTRPLHLNHVLHVPHPHKQLISIHRFNLDNNTFIELHPFFFLIKDQATTKVLFRGPCRAGLYPLLPLPAPTQKLLLAAIKMSSQRWHCRLGHPSHNIIIRFIKNNNLSCSDFDPPDSLCDTCICGKARQLPYPISTGRSKAPLELIFPMFEARPLILLAIKSIMPASLTILVNSRRSIFFSTNLKYFTSLRSSKPLLNECSIAKSWLCKQIGVVNMSVVTLFFVPLVSPT
jgi:hypothetical protein